MTRLTGDLEAEKAKRETVVSATPPQMTYLSPSLPDKREKGYDKAP